MATTDEQRTRAQKASEYIEKVGRVIHHTVTHMQLSNIHVHVRLQVKKTRKSVTDPKNNPKFNFWASPRTRAAAAAAQNYSSQVSRQANIARPKVNFIDTVHNLLSLQLKTA